MRLDSSLGFIPSSVTGAADFLGRLTQLMQPPRAAAPVVPSEELPTPPTTVTPGLLKTTLLGMGVTADAQNLALAEAFANLGLPLTRQTLAEAHVALASSPGAAPMAYALAKSLALPTTPAALKALTTITGGSLTAPRPAQALPEPLMAWLGLSVEGGLDPEAMAGHLMLAARQIGESAEHKIAGWLARHPGAHDGLEPDAALTDSRTTLLRLAAGSLDKDIRRGADALASHLEGQQLMNQASQRAHDPQPLYFAVPFQMQTEQTLVEMRLWQRRSDDETDDLPGETPSLKATVRLAPSRLGRLQIDVMGTLDGALTCRVGAERPATARLIQRSASPLASALIAQGWRTSEVRAETRAEWPPLWHGGDALHGPRACVDWRA